MSKCDVIFNKNELIKISHKLTHSANYYEYNCSPKERIITVKGKMWPIVAFKNPLNEQIGLNICLQERIL